MRRAGLLVAAAWLVGACLGPGAAAAQDERTAGTANALEDVEGEVIALATETAEGDLPVVIVDLRTEEGERRVALAPESVLSEAGFEVAEGDRLRARVFVGGSDAAPTPAAAEGTLAGRSAQPAQKVMNLSRDLLLRLRTFSRAPIWDAHGQWEGSPTRGDQTRRRRPTRRPQPAPTRPPPPPPTRPPP